MTNYYGYDENGVLFCRSEDGTLTWWFKDGWSYSISADLSDCWFFYGVSVA